MTTNGEQQEATEDPDGGGAPRTVAQIVGERLREAREAADMRQADVAKAAQGVGLRWGRSSVAALEAGTRNLSIEELALMPFVVAIAGLPIGDLIKDQDKVHLTDKQFAWGKDFRRLFISHKERQALARDLMERKKKIAPKIPERLLDRMPMREELPPPERLKVALDDLKLTVDRYLGESVWPRIGGELAVKLRHAPWSELDRKIADRIMATPQQVVLISHGLWGRSAMEERDARAAERAQGANKRALQSVRGHVARELIDEVVGEWEDKRHRILNLQERIDGAGEDLERVEALIESLQRTIAMDQEWRSRES